MGKMRKILNMIGMVAVLVVLAGGVFYFRDDLDGIWRRAAARFLPCAVPVRYSIDMFDERFGLNREEFVAVVEEAAQTWSDAAGKKLFVLSESGELKVNLTYDYRQEATDKLKGMGLEIKSGQKSYDGLKSRYESMRSSLSGKQTAYDADVAAFEKRADSYGRQVEQWNEKGGAPPSVYERLEKERINLDSIRDSLNVRLQEINSDIDELNAVVTVLNRLASNLNLEAEEFNRTSGARGEKFQEGEYVRDRYGRMTINIYEFEDREMLLRVLMHEFGHALGLDHLPDDQSVMYELNLGYPAVLSESDLTAVQYICYGK